MRRPIRPLSTLLLGSMLLGSTGCATSSSVQHGALIGTLAGAAVGAGAGVLLTNEDLLGAPEDDPRRGDTALPKAEGIVAAAAIGAVVGAVVGAMAGHQAEQKYVKPKPPPMPPPPSAEGSSAAVGPRQTLQTEDRILGRVAL